MIDDDIRLFGRDPHKACRAYSDPLFLQDHFLSTGHNETIHNGTATFVNYRGHVYGCTCQHVSDAVDDPAITAGPHPTAALMVDRVVLNLSFWTAEGLRTALRTVTPGQGQHQVDVAIVELGHTWDMIREKKQKIAINLDEWEPPPWDDAHLCHAAGYPDEHKSADGAILSAPMTLVTAELSSKLSDSSREFTLSSQLDKPHNFFFSGISGGPILATWGDRFSPIGLVFEGEPSSRTATSGWAGPNDILIRGILLTPQRIEEWLANRT
jgi:hypothetical protein